MSDSALLPAAQVGSSSQNTTPPHDRIEELARQLARTIQLSSRPGRDFPIPARLKTLETVLGTAYQHFEKASRAQIAVPHAAEWLLDNYYVIKQALQQIEEGMPADYYRRLPKAIINGGRKVARAYFLAFALIQQGQARLDADQIKNFVLACQDSVPLKIGEVWALAVMLRLGVLESLAGALARLAQIPFEAGSPLADSWLAEAGEDSGPHPRGDDETVVVNSILSLRMLATLDWKAFFESTSVVEKVLRGDPAEIYAHMDPKTRNRYRNVVEELGNGSSMSEVEIAQTAIELAQAASKPRQRHVGYYLVDSGREALESRLAFHPPSSSLILRWLYRHASLAYLGSIATLTSLLSIAAAGIAFYAGGSGAQILLAALLMALPASAVAVNLVHWLILQIVPPRIIPKLDLKDGIPSEFSTMVVIPTMFKNETDVQLLLRQLENHFLGNADPNLHFALLTDLVDAPQKEMPGEKELLKKARAGIEQLNTRYGSENYKPFLLFHRERVWNPAEDCWMGRERKRGKLMEFNSLLSGSRKTGFTIRVGDLNILPRIKYVITLDSDTTLPRETARRLVAALGHPLNQAEFDPETDEVVAGFTVLQPRLQVRPSTVNLSIFTRVYSGDTKLDLYTRAVSDVYQDLFGEGSYVGKGIYDVAAFERSLHNRVPDNSLLSHDLFEGIHGRCGLVTDVVLFEDYPLHYLTYIHRSHRWIRGDWQLLPWLMPRVPHRTKGKIPNDLSALDRWKILDNLRRSLIGASILTLLLGGWALLPGPPLLWTTLALLPFILTTFTSLISSLGARSLDEVPGTTARPIQQAALHSLFDIVFLPHVTMNNLDAIITTLIRMQISHKRMLQWVTAAHTLNIFGRELKIKVARREMAVAPLYSLAVLVTIIFSHPSALPVAGPFLLAWLFSPYLAVRISRPTYPQQPKPGASQEHVLRMLARSTWLYFEDFVDPEDHWLPPDHFQEDPRRLVAHRTSPTNIGLLLLSTLSAYDLGYIGPRELAVRIRNTFESMKRMERDRGHFLNWYDTHTLNPIQPRYISTVDSGNLAACLLALRQGFRDVAAGPVVRWGGLVDTLDVLSTALEESDLGSAAGGLHDAISRLREKAQDFRTMPQFTPQLLLGLFFESREEMEAMLERLVASSAERFDPATLQRLSTWIDRVRYHLDNLQRDLRQLCPWILAMSQAPGLFHETDLPPELAYTWDELQSMFLSKPLLENVPGICTHAAEKLQRVIDLLPGGADDARAWCISLAGELEAARETAESLLDELHSLSDDADEYFKTMDFRFLFNPQRGVLHIGYNVDSGQLDSSYYDLLASEARIASLLAISKGDVPQSHWLSLARPLTQVNGVRALLSWNGTMFEYLMPALLVESYHDTLIDQSCRAAVEYQIVYGKEKGVPWGISESSYYFFDANQVYQYRAFGAPGLGYKRGLEKDLVIAPYASVLALQFDPQAVLQNLERFRKLDMFGLYGLYESVDFTAGRLGTGQEYAIARSYMAHHQGMTLLALSNYLVGKKMIRRFHADPRIKSVDLLLHEQPPMRAPIEYPNPQEIGFVHPVHPLVSLDPWRAAPGGPSPRLHCLSNGNYSLVITASGSGYSRWHETDLTRWQPDTTLDDWGTWLYLQDQEDGRGWSATSQPTAAPPDYQEVLFYPHKVEFERRDADISLRTSVTIAPENDVEIRQVTLTNHSNRQRWLALTSYAEVTLTEQSDDQRQPAFNRLFVESEFVEDGQVLLFRRRLRSPKEKPVYLAHFAVNNHENGVLNGYETDRARFLGRGGTPRAPAALQQGSGGLSNTTGATLDPIFALQTEITLPPSERAQFTFVTLAAGSRKEALDLARRYRRWPRLRQVFDEAGNQAEQEMIQLELTSPQIERIQKLLSVLLYPASALRADSQVLASNRLGQPGLWPFAISGDYPILLFRIKSESGLDLLDDLLQAHTYWRRRGLMIDLVLLNCRETSYDQEFSDQIHARLTHAGSDAWMNQRGGIFLLHEVHMSEAERVLLATAARAVLDDEAGSLESQLQKLDRQPTRLPRFVAIQSPSPTLDSISAVQRPYGLLFDNGLGGFTPDGREYVIYLDRGQWTPAPWVNVIANSQFGFLVSEAGLGCTWAVNSGENRLTPWHNDPVSDPPSEALYLRDEDTGQLWSPTPLPARADASYLIRHGAGYSIFEHRSHGLDQRLRVFAVPDAPIKIVQLVLKNDTPRTRRINATYYAEWVLGATRADMAEYIVPEFDSRRVALLACNPYNTDFGGRVAFLAATRELHGLTTDRAEFLGELGSYARPAALERVGLSGSGQAGSDPCAAMQILLWLAPGESKEVTFLLGQGDDRDAALELIADYQNMARVNNAWESISRLWEHLLGAVQVLTPDPALDLLLNRWLPYQALSCRIWGRTAFYQSSGAFGFRDQLQDVLAFLHTSPGLARQHILDAASNQFEEGDVLHWWHPPAGKGIRTRCSDNLLWLPYVTAEYVRATGDRSILDEQVPFLAAEPLKEGEQERYGHFPAGAQASLYEHCLRALAKGTTAGPHGLPLMGTNDWNDGMNRVGVEGKGESVWLGWFLYTTLESFAALCEQTDNSVQATDCRRKAEGLRAILEAAGWDGSWYRRAYFDDGTPLGSLENTECQIDSISQSWSVLSAAADSERARKAMEALYTRLVRPDDGLLLLLTPPFDRSLHDPGYIMAYPPGVRENGSQYTHAALWAIWAFAELGEGDRAAGLLRMINPILHTDTAEKAARYCVEPYVVAADVYSMPPHTGRGGWTWYTGSAGWMYRLGVEKILGLQREGNRLKITPCIPRDWREYEIRYRFGTTLYHIHVENPQSVNRGVMQLALDGKLLDDENILLADDGSEHSIIVTLGQPPRS